MKKTRIVSALIALFAVTEHAQAYYELQSGGAAYFGYHAGYSNTSGIDNTFIGQEAGLTNVSGNYNTFLGYEAGYSNTTDGGTFIGYQAGKSNTIGPYNAFIGYQAGYSNTSGLYNTFVGSFAGFSNTTTSHNTIVGFQDGTAGYAGAYNAILGDHAGNANTTGGDNTFIGAYAGYGNGTGNNNTYVGESAGANNTTGSNNTALGESAGGNSASGSGNVFVGYSAGANEPGSNMLYIDNCYGGGACNAPLIYGQFDAYRLRFNGMTEIHFNGQPKSQINFSQSSTDTGGYLTSVGDNNFFASSGARFDGSLTAPNQWVQRSGDGNSVIAGSGATGYRIFTSSGKSLNANFAPTVRLHINYAGEFGINRAPQPGHEIHTVTGAYESGGTWVNGSSREFKENIHSLATDAAEHALEALNPVTFNYKTESGQQHVGFIAEDVPELVAMKDRKGLSPMDIVAVLTKVVQEQRQELRAERLRNDTMEQQLRRLTTQFAEVQARLPH
jgi:hypothetical protein